MSLRLLGGIESDTVTIPPDPSPSSVYTGTRRLSIYNSSFPCAGTNVELELTKKLFVLVEGGHKGCNRLCLQWYRYNNYCDPRYC